MRRFYFLLGLIGLALPLFAQEDTLQLSGTYDGRLLYFQNPETDEGGVFSTISFWMNGQRYPDDSLNQAAYRIIPPSVGIQKGDSLTIQIVYHSGYRPRLIAPIGPQPKNLKITDFRAENEWAVCWNVIGTEDIICFDIERYQWNKWVGVGTVCAIYGDKTYCHDVYPMHGENLLRIVSDHDPLVYSNTLTFYSDIPEITHSYDKKQKLLTFSEFTLFELYDEKGNLLEDDFVKEWNMQQLPKGGYYVNYGMKTIKIRIK